MKSYAAIAPDKPGYIAITIDDGDSKSIAKDVASWIRRGWTVQHVTDEEAKRGFTQFIDWLRAQPKKAKRKP